MLFGSVTQSVQLLAAPWTVAHEASLPMEFSRQEYWSRLSFATAGHLPNLGIEPASRLLHRQADSSLLESPGKPL